MWYFWCYFYVVLSSYLLELAEVLSSFTDVPCNIHMYFYFISMIMIELDSKVYQPRLNEQINQVRNVWYSFSDPGNFCVNENIFS